MVTYKVPQKTALDKLIALIEAEGPEENQYDELSAIWDIIYKIKKIIALHQKRKGTNLVMIRLFKPDHKTPKEQVVNVRLRFEFPMKKMNSKNPEVGSL